jgi:hypothetical protein
MTNQLTREEIVAIDTNIARLYNESTDLYFELMSAKKNIEYLLPLASRSGRGGARTFTLNGVQEIATVENLRRLFNEGAIGSANDWNRKVEAEKFEKYDAISAKYRAKKEEINEAEKQYKGWSRFFLVHGGHIHSSMDCSTCNKVGKATSFGWLPELSGLTEADAVAQHGAILCTVCFPSAPVEWTNGVSHKDAERLAKRCDGSGKVPAEKHSKYPYRYGKCSCGEWQTLTTLGLVRAHNKPKGK